jgi:hypothetical protein
MPPLSTSLLDFTIPMATHEKLDKLQKKKKRENYQLKKKEARLNELETSHHSLE